METTTIRPLVALAMGDPNGISPELTAQLASDPEVQAAARLLVIGDRRILDMGAADAGVTLNLPAVSRDELDKVDGPALLDLGNMDVAAVERGKATSAGGGFAMGNFVAALEMARIGAVEAVTFTPFNKQAMRMVRAGYDDEVGVISEVLQSPEHGREFNILGGLWNARVTSHIPLREVAGRLSVDAIANAGLLASRCMQGAGMKAPRIAVAALNPHAGDGGNFGMEDMEIIAPAVDRLKKEGVLATGPVPADTVFVRARKGEFDAVLTMFHDQGQIAMKLLGFDQGVTFLGGYAVPICTPAHGTAYDIAGRGIADIKAARNAVLLAANMALVNARNTADRV